MKRKYAIIAACLATAVPFASGQLTEDLKLTAPNPAAGDEFGFTTDLSGTTAIIGARFDDDAGSDSGSAYVFDTATGQQLFKLTASDGASTDQFGFSVALSGTTAVVGAVLDDSPGFNSGSAYIFDTSTGQELFKLSASDAQAMDEFGRSVAISGNTAIVGALRGDASSIDSGSAYVFDTTTGQQLFKLTASDAETDDGFGRSVAISGSTAIVGASDNDDGGDDSGSAYVYDTMTGHQLFKLTASDAASEDRFGWWVGISGNTAIVGAPDDDTAGSDSGSAYIFDLTTGQQLFKLMASDASAGDSFGRYVAIFGNTAIVGARFADDAGVDSGSAYVFDTTTGQQLFKLAASDATDDDRFGVSVAISGTSIIVGAFGNDDGGIDSGSAYVFSLNPRVAQQPQPAIVSDGETAAFNVGLDDETGVSYQWRRDAVDLTDNASISGSHTASLEIITSPSDVGVYDCVLTNTSGSTTTAAAVLAVRPNPNPCIGDIADDFGTLLMQGDGQVSFGDFLALLGLIGPCP